MKDLTDEQIALSGGVKGRLSDLTVQAANGNYYKVGRKEFKVILGQVASGIVVDPAQYGGRLVQFPDAIDLNEVSREDAELMLTRIDRATTRVQEAMRAAEKEREIQAAMKLLKEAGRL